MSDDVRTAVLDAAKDAQARMVALKAELDQATADRADAVRRLRAEGWSAFRLAVELGVSPTAINKAVR